MPTEALATVSSKLALITAAALMAPAPPAWAQESATELTPFQRAKAERLLEGRLPCLGCHALDGRGGRIGPDLTTVHLRLSREEIHARISDPERSLPGGLMPRVPMPPRWRELVAAYLAMPREPAAAPPPPSSSSAGSAAPPPAGNGGGDAAALYARHCAACHGRGGGGDGWNAAHLPVRPTAHADSGTLSIRSDDALFDLIHAGGFVYGRSARMPPFGSLLSDEEIRSLVRHIRSLCRCRGPAWSREGMSVPAGGGR